MIPSSFDYSNPGSIDEAIALLHEHGEDAKVLAGGHSLIPMMKLRFASPTHLIDINNIPGLSYIKEEDGRIKLGALTREVDLEESELLQSKFPIFKDASKLIADPQVRNFGTVGGNLAHGDAANDHPAVMIALNAEITITGKDGTRTVPIDEFFFGFYSTAIQHGELLTEISFPVASEKFSNAYHKVERKVGDYATAGAAVHLVMDGENCTYAGIGLTNVNATPLRATRSEQALVGTDLNDETINTAAQYASEDCNPSADLRGSEDYKRRVVKSIVKRMINQAKMRIN